MQYKEGDDDSTLEGAKDGDDDSTLEGAKDALGDVDSTLEGAKDALGEFDSDGFKKTMSFGTLPDNLFCAIFRT